VPGREPEREHPNPETVCFSFAHFSEAFVGKCTAFDAGALPNGSAEKPMSPTPYCFGRHPRK
jgi:hypothetical protein